MELGSSLKMALLGLESDADPYPVYARLRREEPVCRRELRAGLPCWLVSRYDDARAALADPRLSRDPRAALPPWQEADRGRLLEDRSHLGVHLLTREPPDHTRLRQLVSAHFTLRRIERIRGRVQQIADSLIDLIQPRGRAELIAEFAYPLAITVMCDVLGIPAEDRVHFRQWTSNAVGLARDPAGGYPASVPKPGDYLRTLVTALRTNRGEGLISALIVAADQSRLSETELLSMVFLLLLTGHEGTVGLIGNGVVSLLGNPRQLALLRDHPDMAGSAVDEILRYDGPMEFAGWRFATQPVPIGDKVIPVGAPVLIALAAAHRDPTWFTEPDRLDITRTSNPHMGFGYGIHYCLGAALARIEGNIALATLFRRLPDLALAIPVTRLRRQPSLVLRGLHELPVTFTPVGSPARRG
jgi:cytochrome P450